MRLALILPAGDGAAPLAESLMALREWRRHGHRVIVVEDGHADRPALEVLADRVLFAPRGWSRQANAGSRAPEVELADALLFLPRGVRLPAQAFRSIARALANSSSPWGRFDVRYRHPQGILRVPLALAAALANAVARLTGICTREQAIFVSRGAFLALQGFAPVDPAGNATADLAADCEFSRRARLLGPPVVLHEPALVDVAVSGWWALLRSVGQTETRRLAAALGLDR